MVDRLIGNRIINSPYPAAGPPLCLHGRRVERLERRVTAARESGAYSDNPVQAGDVAPMQGRWGQSR